MISIDWVACTTRLRLRGGIPGIGRDFIRSAKLFTSELFPLKASTTGYVGSAAKFLSSSAVTREIYIEFMNIGFQIVYLPYTN